MEKNNIDQFENILRPEINKNVVGTLAIDLGSSTTVVVFQKENGQPPELLDLPPISRSIGEIPSLIWKSSEKEESYLIGQQIIAVLNFPKKQIANIQSEFLTLGAINNEFDDVILIQPSSKTRNGSKIC